MELETYEKEFANVIFAVQTLSANTAKIISPTVYMYVYVSP